MSCLHAYYKIVWRRQGVGVNSDLNSIRTMVNSDLNSVRTLANSDLIFIWTLANSDLIFIWTLANSDLVFMRSELVSGECPNWPKSESSKVRIVRHSSRARAGLGVRGPWKVRTKSPKCLRRMKQCARTGLDVTWVYGPREVRTKSPKFLGHMKLQSSSLAQYGSKTREPVSNPTTCRASPQDFSKAFRPVWVP